MISEEFRLEPSFKWIKCRDESSVSQLLVPRAGQNIDENALFLRTGLHEFVKHEDTSPPRLTHFLCRIQRLNSTLNKYNYDYTITLNLAPSVPELMG